MKDHMLLLNAVSGYCFFGVFSTWNDPGHDCSNQNQVKDNNIGVGYFFDHIQNETIPKSNKIIFDQRRKFFDEKQISFC